MRVKPFPWRFWINFVLIIGIGPGLGFGFGVGSNSKSFWIGLFVGLVSSLLFVLLAALWYRRVMRKRDPTFNFADYNFRSEATFELPVSANEAYRLCDDALHLLPGFYVTKREPQRLYIEGMTGGGNVGYWSFGAPGEKLQVDIKAVSATTSSAYVRSKPGTAMVVLDFGKNRQNIASISTAINAAIQRRLDEANAVAERAELERALTVAKLNALQAQIEPHFLYNTLANAQSLTRSDPSRADLMLGHLIAFLRLSVMSDAVSELTLQQEANRVRAYLEIMKIRMGARLDYSIDIADPLGEYSFSPLMLQTLVENAIKHGLEPKLGGGRIDITAAVIGDKLQVQVSDNGAGLGSNTAGSGIGLKNIRERLKLAYGDHASLTLSAGTAGGMTATIVMPLITTNTES